MSRAPVACPTSSSSATPRAARPRCTRCSARTRRSSCRMLRSRGSSPRAARAAAAAARRRPARRRSSEYLDAVRAGARRPARRRGLAAIPGLARPRRADRRRCGRTRGSSRSCASRRASCARCTCSCAEQRRDRAGLPQGDRAGGRAPRRAADPAPLAAARSSSSTPSTSATSSSCAAITTAFGAEQVLVLIYDDFRRDNEATVREVLRFLGVDADGGDRAVRGQTTAAVRSARAQAAAPTRRVRARQNPASPAARASAERAARQARCAASVRSRWRNGSCTGPPRTPDDGSDDELRRRFKPEVVALSDYLGRDLVASGAMTRRLSRAVEPPRRAAQGCEVWMSAIGESGRVHARGEIAPPRVPDFFIVGHPKCGTTALYEMLRRAPADLHAGAQGAALLRARAASRSGAGAGRMPETLEGYLALFAAAGDGPARRRGLAALPAVARRPRRAIAELQPAREDRRDSARAGELPALVSPADGA